MKFDSTAPGGGMEIYCTLQTGKAILEWKFYFQKEQDGLGQGVNDGAKPYIKLFLRDEDGAVALEGRQCVQEEELIKAVLLHPHLWNSIRKPYLYTAEAFLMEETKNADTVQQKVLDRISCSFPIHSFCKNPGKGWLLNGEPFCRNAVGYKPAKGEALVRELMLFRDMGANTVCVEELAGQPVSFYETCRELGLVVWAAGTEQEVDGSLFWEGELPTDLFYQYKARWCQESFVYISSKSLTRQKNGNYSVTVYSNCKKVALYTDGVLFEFQCGETEFVFREIPFPSLFLCLSAEAEDCTMSVSIHKTFTKASLFHDN